MTPPARGPGPPARRAGAAPTLVDAFDAAFVDLDGVVYRGDTAVEGAESALAAVRSAGRRVVFLTNNASRCDRDVAARLVGFGVAATQAEVITSATAAIALLRLHCPPPGDVLVVGAASLVDAVAGAGYRVGPQAGERPAAVVQGWSPDIGYRDLARAALAVQAGAHWIATNLDECLPADTGLVPGNGALVRVVGAGTAARPVLAGKPEPLVYSEAVRRSRAERPIAVGDRLDSDIAGARRAGLPSLLVLSGVTAVADLLRAPEQHRPTFVGWDVTALVAPPLRLLPRTEVTGTGFEGGDGWSAELIGETLRLRCGRAPADADEALRLACLATWSLADRGLMPAGVVGLPSAICASSELVLR